ncbi:MAG: metallophosphoesterase [candidate division WOR-3 bacterium]|nr:metallophosphoesterase [candidate division WOR-3 bacterium]
MKIMHISDIHKTGSFFVKEWGDKIKQCIEDESPELVIVTGDITDNGYLYEYEEAKNFLDGLNADNMLVVPGNHDSRNGGYLIFEEFFKTRYPLFENEQVIVLGIDSSEPDLDDGHIGRANYKYIEDKLRDNEDKIKIIALHHHLIPIPGTGRERHIPVDSGDFLKLIKEMQIDFVLSGHKHYPWIWRLENTYFITAGTAATKRLKGRSFPSYNMLEIREKRIEINEINVITSETKLTLSKEWNGGKDAQ